MIHSERINVGDYLERIWCGIRDLKAQLQQVSGSQEQIQPIIVKLKDQNSELQNQLSHPHLIKDWPHVVNQLRGEIVQIQKEIEGLPFVRADYNPVSFRTQERLKQDVLDKYKQEKFQYVNDPRLSSDSLFELQQTITLSKDTLKIEVDMFDEGRVVQVSNPPVFLYTDYLGPCVAAIGKCKVSESSMLIGITHLYPEYEEFDDTLKLQVNLILNINNTCKNINKNRVIQEKQFTPRKFISFIEKFSLHTSYKGEAIELFFAGGNGNLYATFWRELTTEYAKSLPRVTVIGTCFNPYRATPEIQANIRCENLRLSFLAGITNYGSIFLHKSHAIDFNF